MNDALDKVDSDLAGIIGDKAETVDEAHARLGSAAPRVTPADIEANIASEHYFTAFTGAAPHGYFPAETSLTKGDVEVPMVVQSLELLTLCVLVTRNGFTIVGHSAPAAPANFNAQLGRKFAREDAVKKLWPLMGYNLRERLWQQQAPPASAPWPLPADEDAARATGEGMPEVPA